GRLPLECIVERRRGGRRIRRRSCLAAGPRGGRQLDVDRRRQPRPGHIGGRRDGALVRQRRRLLDQLGRHAGPIGRRLPARLTLADHPTTSCASQERYGSSPPSTGSASPPGSRLPQAIRRSPRSAVTRARASASLASVVSATTAVVDIGSANVRELRRLSKLGEVGGGWHVHNLPRPPPTCLTSVAPV